MTFGEVCQAGVLACWFALMAVMLVRKRPPKTTERRRSDAALPGIMLQGFGFAALWIFRRPPDVPPLPFGDWFHKALLVSAPLIAAGSVWLTASAIRTLGAQWTVAARLIEGHRLITTGPFGIIRHPIYTALLGFLVATGIVATAWPAFAFGIISYCLGLQIRARAEERLLREEFGPEYETYAAKVPAVLPRVFAFNGVFRYFSSLTTL